jgi:hypothetical protein
VIQDVTESATVVAIYEFMFVLWDLGLTKLHPGVRHIERAIERVREHARSI